MPFDDDSHQSIEKWVELFEDVVNMFNLTGLHKLVFRKRALKGKAKLYIQSETSANSCKKLKDLLLSEFGYSVNSVELHEMLRKRKLNDDESLEEYFLKMKQLCNCGNVEDTAFMQYVMNGVPHSVIRKSILYGCHNLSEFKQKLRVYEKMRSDYDNAKPNKPKFGYETKDRIKASKIENKDKFKATKLNNIRCFNCGALGHKSSVSTAKPLRDLHKKDSNYSFDLKERESLNELKQILSKEPVLCLYNPKSGTEIHTDASVDGFGACLLQKSIVDNQLHPVCYKSHKTSDTERKYSSYELEVMALIEALKKFRPYVLGIPFKIVTDCIAFKQTISKKDTSSKIARWALMLEEYDYVIEHL
ncbi:hypothetical protein AVEN_16962-1 [Araneus ventricosus]|uniref:Reverse transcriptase RNase H-like domain-containing protein n=1 Tax=Araneus ventricosus TaxID=182803 RepID=A0A4Y2D7U8_ARAVE|nr:hypothetical protein AVEN_16962-1 [Araneus ventricosus]